MYTRLDEQRIALSPMQLRKLIIIFLIFNGVIR